MAIFKRLTKKQIEDNYTHYGFFLGIVPIYINKNNPSNPSIEVRNWVPDWLFYAVNFLFGLFTITMTIIDSKYKPMFSFKITGEILKTNTSVAA